MAPQSLELSGKSSPQNKQSGSVSPDLRRCTSELGLNRTASQTSIRQTNSHNAESPFFARIGAASLQTPPSRTTPSSRTFKPIVLKFTPGEIGASGIQLEGSQVTWSALQAWTKGVRPGWIIKTIDGQTVQEEDETEELLRKAEVGQSRFEITFQEGKAKFGMRADGVNKADIEKEENCARLRRTFKFQRHIECTEHRGITYSQLERAVNYAKEYCHNWRDTAPANMSIYSGQKLRMDFFNLHHMSAWIILPATGKHKCAFVELVANQKQIPMWFVSHWWGGPIVEFMSCLKTHATKRSMGFDSPYWICAYAIRQHHLQAELDDLKKASFVRAMQMARFQILLMVDERTTPFVRLWCVFELSMCLDRLTTQLDIVAFHDREAKMLTQGLTEEEEAMELQRHGLGFEIKAAREATFPIEVVAESMEIELQTKAETGNEEDRNSILQCIIGGNPALEAPTEHPQYTETNGKLHAFFARLLLLCVSKATKNAGRAQTRILQALRNDVWRRSVDMHLEGLSSNGMELLVQSLPPDLRDLKLRLWGSSIVDKDLEALSEHLPEKLSALSLDIRDCGKLSEDGKDAFKNTLMRKGIVVDLNLFESDAIKSKEDWENPRKNMGAALGISLCRQPEKMHMYKHRVVPAVPELMRALIEDERANVRKSAVRALGSLGDKALEAMPVLERAAQDDSDDSVKKAALEAIAQVNGTTAPGK